MTLVETIAPRQQVAELRGELRRRPDPARRGTERDVALSDWRHALQQQGHRDVGVAERSEQVRGAVGELRAQLLERGAHDRSLLDIGVEAKVVLARKPARAPA